MILTSPPAKSDQRALAVYDAEMAERSLISLPAVISVIETNKLLFGTIPDANQIAEKLQLRPSDVTSILKTKKGQEMRDRRGISLDTKNYLTPEQVAAVNVMLDFYDQRSQAAKLKALGITSAKWQTWQADPIISAYMKRRAENILDDSAVAEGHTALLKQVTKGNVQAIKLLYEVSGRHRDSTSLNVEFFIGRVIEIIQQEVGDQATLTRIAEKFKTLMGEVQ